MEITRHFTTSVYIVHEGRVLLHLHKKLGLMLPVGGHIERDELPEEAAIREIQEEAGVPVRFHGATQAFQDDDRVRCLLSPQHLLLQDINQGHQHIDFVYYAMAQTDVLAPEEEIERLRWMAREEVERTEMPVNVRFCALEALSILT